MDLQETIKLVIEKSNSKYEMAKLAFENEYYSDCVSSCYYSVFHAIRALLFTKDKEYSSHTQTIGNFNRYFIKENKLSSWITKEVQGLFLSRQICDYNYKASKLPNKEKASRKLEITRKILEECKNYLVDNGFYKN